jgi:hypothetical protein
MRTKALLVAAIFAAGLATSMAQSEYSLNIVGYVNSTVPAGKWALISNPLNATNNNYQMVLQNPPEGLQAYKYTGSGWISTEIIDGAWDGDDLGDVNPGEGLFVKAPAGGDYVNTFVGEVILNSTNPIPAGFAIRSSILPQAGGISSVLGYVAGEGDQVYQYDPNSGYIGNEVIDGAWDSAEPVPAVGEAFWINAKTASDWVRNFTVAP